MGLSLFLVGQSICDWTDKKLGFMHFTAAIVIFNLLV